MYFHDYELAIETDKNKHSYGYIDYGIKEEVLIEFRAINAAFIHMNQSTKKTLINKISTRLLWLQSESGKYCLIISNNWNLLC